MKSKALEQSGEDNDLPFNGPIEWYPYICRACNFKMLVEDIIIDSFPPDGPGKCPILCCPDCGKNFIRDLARDSIFSETDPNPLLNLRVALLPASK